MSDGITRERAKAYPTEHPDATGDDLAAHRHAYRYIGTCVFAMRSAEQDRRYAEAIRQREAELDRVFIEYREVFELLGQPVNELRTQRSTTRNVSRSRSMRRKNSTSSAPDTAGRLPSPRIRVSK